ncbi:MAG: hypothetical protein K2X35_02520 [Bryobacteraceae bacterium]|nr:hypothetical protein [Bryobacteraceae bacterium]
MIAEWVVYGAFAYAACGLVFAIAFLTRGVEQLDPQTRGTGIGFRLLLLPGTAALWPLLLSKWMRS